MRIYLDIEATEFGELLQLGCVTEKNERFGVCVQPAFTKVTPRITALTGITQDDADESTPVFEGIINLVEWALDQSDAYGIHFFTFGKGDRLFLKKTYDLHLKNGKSALDPGMRYLNYLYENTTNCQSTVYKAFNKGGLSLRSYYLTMTNQPVPHEHNALTDAVYLYQIMTAIDSGWTLPEGAEFVKCHKPALPPRTDIGTMIPELNRKVVCYYTNNKGVDKAQVFPNCVAAARALCQQAINSRTEPAKVGYRVLEAALNGEPYCNRRFFLVD